ncbi:hypothetical protein PAPYR_3779 [Paratrimastix pyriformis]|uniref:Calponin-homology (CH) domain-containing protein n=1 Tax=Paratrimastix pyriformis TaxID=342808 RepID=A0ABQ8ULJ0_9EUKA|nr:hypothetical protein PAPYR_3779 [Paratrimastix pyriformis]
MVNSRGLRRDVGAKACARWIGWFLGQDCISEMEDFGPQLRDGRIISHIIARLTGTPLDLGSAKGSRSRRIISATFNRLAELGMVLEHEVSEDSIVAGQTEQAISFTVAIARYVHVQPIKFRVIETDPTLTSDAALLAWVREVVAGRRNVESFGPCWADGFVLSMLALLTCPHPPGLWTRLSRDCTPLERCSVAISMLTECGLPPLIEPTDLAKGILDPRIVTVYAGLCYALCQRPALPESGQATTAPGPTTTTLAQPSERMADGPLAVLQEEPTPSVGVAALTPRNTPATAHRTEGSPVRVSPQGILLPPGARTPADGTATPTNEVASPIGGTGRTGRHFGHVRPASPGPALEAARELSREVGGGAANPESWTATEEYSVR